MLDQGISTWTCSHEGLHGRLMLLFTNVKPDSIRNHGSDPGRLCQCNCAVLSSFVFSISLTRGSLLQLWAWVNGCLENCASEKTVKGFGKIVLKFRNIWELFFAMVTDIAAELKSTCRLEKSEESLMWWFRAYEIHDETNYYRDTSRGPRRQTWKYGAKFKFGVDMAVSVYGEDRRMREIAKMGHEQVERTCQDGQWASDVN